MNNLSINFEIKSNSTYQINKFINKRLSLDCLELLKKIPNNSIDCAFFDPQYRSILNKMKYGNEGKTKEISRCSLNQMDDNYISEAIKHIEFALKPSKYLFLWVDKFILCENIHDLIKSSNLKIVDLIVWNKDKMGMGYRTRNQAEFLIILQKYPIKAKGTFTIRNIRNVWTEKINKKNHVHEKPYLLLEQLVLATTKENELILDPAAGSFKIMEIAIKHKRNFLGTDINEN